MAVVYVSCISFYKMYAVHTTVTLCKLVVHGQSITTRYNAMVKLRPLKALDAYFSIKMHVTVYIENVQYIIGIMIRHPMCRLYVSCPSPIPAYFLMRKIVWSTPR